MFGLKTDYRLDDPESFDGVNFTFNSAPKKVTSTNPVSLSDQVLSFGIDYIQSLASIYHLVTSASVDLGIDSVGYSVGHAEINYGVTLNRQEQATSIDTQSISFVSRQTGQAVAVPIDYTTSANTYNPNGTFVARDENDNKKHQVPCNQGFSGSDTTSITYLTGATDPNPAFHDQSHGTCFIHSDVNFTKLQTSLNENSTSLAFHVGDGSFDFSKVKIVSNTAITSQVVSQRSLGFTDGVDLSILSGQLNIAGLGGGSFGPLYSNSYTAYLGSVSIGTQAADFGTVNTGSVIGFDGTTGRTAVASLTGNSITTVGGSTYNALDLGNVRVGQQATGNLAITNAAANDGFSEGLIINGAGTLSNNIHVGAPPTGTIAPGSSALIAVGIDTNQAGTQQGFVVVGNSSDGTQTNNGTPVQLGNTSAVVTARVYQTASPTTIVPVAFGNHRVGDSVSTTLKITNAAVAGVPIGFQEGLDASTGTTSTGFSARGGVTNLAAGATSTNGVTIGLDTSSAGAKSGSTSVNLASNGTGTSGLATLGLGAQQVALTGAVYRTATPVVMAFGNLVGQSTSFKAYARVGDTVGTSISITNGARPDGYSEGLGVTGTVSGTGATFSTANGLIAAGGQSRVSVTLNTSTAGNVSGTLGLALTSDGTGTSDLAPLALASKSITLSGAVYAAAVANVSPSINFGVVRVGDSVSQNITVTNGASGALADTLVTRMGTAPAGFTLGATPGALAQGQSGTIAVGLDTSKAGILGGTAGLDFISHNPVLSDLSLGHQGVELMGTVNNHANAAFLSGGSVLTYDATLGGYVFDLGKVHQTSKLGVTGFTLENFVSGPADTLSGIIGNGPKSIFSLAGPVTVGPLAAGGVSDQFGINVDTRRTGRFTGELTFNGVGTNASDPVGETRYAALFLTGQVTVPEPAGVALFGLGAAAVAWRRRRLATQL